MANGWIDRKLDGKTVPPWEWEFSLCNLWKRNTQKWTGNRKDAGTCCPARPIHTNYTVSELRIKMDAEFEFDLREVSGRICDLVRNQKRGDTDDSTCVPMTCIELIQSAVAKREDIVAPALSVQQLISGTYVRDTAFGTTSDYLRYAKFNRITTEANYPYTGPKYVQTRHGRSAVYDNYHVKQNLAMLEPRYNISRIIKSIPQNGIIDHIRNNELPVSLAYACQSSWLNWKTWDVYSAPPREQCDARHDVTAIGYGNKGGQPYLIIKNSYGEEWGKNGYGRIALKFADNVNPYSAE